MQAPFRGEFTGQFLKPEKLTGGIDQSVAKLIKQEQKLGLPAVTDGGFRFDPADFFEGLKGIGKAENNQLQLTGKVEFNPDHPAFAAFQFVQKTACRGSLVKQVVPSPAWLLMNQQADAWPQFYPEKADLLRGLAAAFHHTLRHFYDLGCRYLQVDDPAWAALSSHLAGATGKPGYPHWVTLAEDAMDVINGMLAGIPDDMTVTTYLPEGKSGLGAAAKYLGQVDYDGYLLGFDSSKAPDFSDLKAIWNYRPLVRIVLGLVDAKSEHMEDQKKIIGQIKAAAQQVPLRNLALGTSSGFAGISPDQQWAKLRLVEEIAKQVWPQG